MTALGPKIRLYACMDQHNPGGSVAKKINAEKNEQSQRRKETRTKTVKVKQNSENRQQLAKLEYFCLPANILSLILKT